MRRPILLLAALLVAAPACAQEPTQAQREQWQREAEERLRNDWAWHKRYAEENAALAPNPRHPRIVFMGDSITQGWRDKVPAFFVSERVGRGIGGQTTAQMLGRFRQDVIELRPAVVHIMAATNDIAGNTGPMTLHDIQGNFRSMVELAHANGIRVILASVPPADAFPWRPGLAVSPRIAEINDWLKRYAAETGSVYADYWSALHDPTSPGGAAMRKAYAYDGVHPTEAGYAAMQPVAERAIREALSKPAPQKIPAAE